jgi:glycosyltransferase involved in cell wall biosynthesis
VKLACVIHRFGADIAGGSESHCRAVALHLAQSHDVTVLTSCAHDHVTWENHYSEGESTDGPLRVRRFPAVRRRDLARFRDISRKVFSGRGSAEEQEEWFRENGPLVPALLDDLRARGGEYDRVLFWSYRYFPTYFGLPLVADRAILLPTAEEDPLIRAAALERFFALPAGYLFLTPEEQELVSERAPIRVPSAVIGCGIDPAETETGSGRVLCESSGKTLPDPVSSAEPFVLYLGRVDPNKGCESLLRYFTRYIAARTQHLAPSTQHLAPSTQHLAPSTQHLAPSTQHLAPSTQHLAPSTQHPASSTQHPLQLVLAGPVNMPVPEHPSIRTLGFVADDVREALLSRARVLLMPSPYESLSMVVLEAWNHGLPVLVNARCAVLRGQVRRADGGLHYRTGAEFVAALDRLLDRPDEARTLGAQGLAFVEREYRWPTVVRKIEDVLVRSGSRASPV